MTQKLFEAHRMVSACLGTHGVWAAPDRYAYQCWTRDFSMAIQPLLLQGELFDIALKHLLSIAERQKGSGQIPILFLDGPRGHLHFVADKIRRTVRSQKMSFMLRRYIEEYGDVGQLTPGTRDSELHFVIAVGEFLNAVPHISSKDRVALRHAAIRAIQYIEDNLLDDDGFLLGCDWRDTMEKQFAKTPLLSNNCLLVHAYDLWEAKASANILREKINKRFWLGDILLDWPGVDKSNQVQWFDPLGGALAVLYDVVGADRYEDLRRCFTSVSTKYGHTIQCKHNPLGPGEAEVIERTNGIVVWPFVVGFVALAFMKMYEETGAGFHDGSRTLHKLEDLDGFSEWYDPETGKGYGAPRQLWSATLYARAHAAWDQVKD